MASTINWPSSLPQYVLEEGYSRNLRSNVIRTNNSLGEAKVRRRNTKIIYDLNVSMVMSTTQFSTFETFFQNTIGLGALSFNFPKPENPSTTIEVRIVTEQQAYSVTPETGTGYFIVGFTMETL